MKNSRLVTLPPAARVASIRLREDGDLQVKLRYVCQPWEKESCWFGSNHEYQGVPYQRWLAHAGKIVRLWEWEGTGDGMIGGPAKRQVVGVIWWSESIEFPFSMNECELLETVDDLSAWLEDERYEFSEANRRSIEEKIAMLTYLSRTDRTHLPWDWYWTGSGPGRLFGEGKKMDYDKYHDDEL